MPRWTEEDRKKQSEMMRKNKPWTKSTGPKTQKGKDKAAQNAYKHGMRSRDYDEICRLLRAQKRVLETLND